MMMLLFLLCGFAFADDISQQLMSIATQEAQIAGIGANKVSMLYGTGNALRIIQRWDQVEHRPALSKQQILQIKQLEFKKQSIIKVRHEN